MTTFECCICYENLSINKLYLTVCVHKFCNECFTGWKQTCKDKLTCPVCRTNLNEEKKDDFSDLYEGRINFVDWQIKNLNTFSQDFYFKYISSSNEEDENHSDDSDESEEDYEMEEGDDWDEIEEWQRTNYYGEEYV